MQIESTTTIADLQADLEAHRDRMVTAMSDTTDPEVMAGRLLSYAQRCGEVITEQSAVALLAGGDRTRADVVTILSREFVRARPDDEWSGRRNDLRRAIHEGRRTRLADLTWEWRD